MKGNSERPRFRKTSAGAALSAFVLFPFFLICWELCLGLALRQTLGISLGDLLVALSFGYGLQALLGALFLLAVVPFACTLLVLRSLGIPLAAGALVCTLFLCFGLWRMSLTGRESVRDAKQGIEKMAAYSDAIRSGASVGAISFSLSEPVTEGDTLHYIRQFKAPFALAEVTLPLDVRTRGEYHFELTVSGKYPAERWSEAVSRPMNAADQNIEKKFEWNQQLDEGQQTLSHRFPAESINTTTSWVRESDGKVFLRLFRVVQLDERLKMLGTSREERQQKFDSRFGKGSFAKFPELNVGPGKTFLEPVLESTQAADALPVSWLMAR